MVNISLKTFQIYTYMIPMTFVGVTSAKSKQTKEYGKIWKKSLPITWTIPTPFRAHKSSLFILPSVWASVHRECEHEQPRGSKQGLQVPSYGRSWKTGFQANTSLLTFAGNNGNWGTSFVLVCWKQVTSRWQRCQTSCDIGQQWQIWKALDVGLQFLADLGHPSKLLFIFLRKRREKRPKIKNKLIYSAFS